MSKKFRFTISWKLQLFAGVTILLFGVMIYGLILPTVEKEKRFEREAKLRAVVEVAVSLMQYYENGIRSYKYKTDPDFPATRALAMKHLLQDLNAIRYEKDEYLFILDGFGTMIMHPTKPGLVGSDMTQVKAPDSSRPFNSMVLNAMRDNETFVRYNWLSKWSHSVYEPQTSYARYFYPWNWIVCSSVYTQDINDAVRITTLRTTATLLCGAIVGWLILYLISLLITRPIIALTRQVRVITANLDNKDIPEVTIKANDEVGELAGSFRNLLYRLKKVMYGLRESEENLSTTLHSIGDAVIATDISGKITRMNPVAEYLTGWSFDQSRGEPLEDIFVIVDSRSGEVVENPIRKVLASKRPVRLANHIALKAKDGAIRQIADSGAPIRDSHGVICGVVLVFHDVSDEYRLREEQLRSEERFRTIFNSANDAIFILDGLSGMIVDVNDRMLEMYGYADKRVVTGKTMDMLSSSIGQYNETFGLDRIKESLELSQTQVFEWYSRRADGSLFWIEVNLKKVILLGEERILVIARNIDERKQIQERMRQMEKMEAIGQLAGGIAHDFNNQLTGALGFADLLKMELYGHPVQLELAEGAIAAIIRCTGLTAQLLAFARKGKTQNTVVDMDAIITEVINLLTHSIDKKIIISKSLAATSHNTTGDPTQLQNALLNLAINARDAMPNGGSLIFSTETVFLGVEQCKRFPFNVFSGQYIKVSVTDTGHGIEKDKLNKIFEPFYTTKGPGKGTGLGLASVFGTIRSHDGAIETISSVGVGSTFVLYLRVTDSIDPTGVLHHTAVVARGKGKILIVDDDATARTGCIRMVEHLGYSTVYSCDGAEAVGYFRNHFQDIEMVILDMVMPVMNGSETYSGLTSINSKIKVLLVSGYTFNSSVQGLIDKGANGFLQKPYTIAQLSGKIGDILNTNSTKVS